MLTLRFCRCLPAAGQECCLEGAVSATDGWKADRTKAGYFVEECYTCTARAASHAGAKSADFGRSRRNPRCRDASDPVEFFVAISLPLEPCRVER